MSVSLQTLPMWVINHDGKMMGGFNTHHDAVRMADMVGGEVIAGLFVFGDADPAAIPASTVRQAAPAKAPSEKLLSLSQAESKTGISQYRISAAVERGELQSRNPKKGRGQWKKFLPSELMAWAKGQKKRGK